ncbi:MAG: aminotransferase class I/II-fold pyridoxal phosphate-dependent enzyme, partial [Candidatus Eisenbacteria bacterium]|nr:aminotransferase class I/II-fold pyridoxal phosphate-dependent enzyme [Candidatus Eisenbacteria bacterium]
MDRSIDFRSDTVTRPTPAMREAMVNATVGDDVMREDPSINLLEERTAKLFGKEAALFTPSGTMANLLAIASQTVPGDELLTHRDSHVYYYEAAGYAAVAGCSIRFVSDAGAPKPGLLTPEALQQAIRPKDDHFPTPRLVTFENTHNRGGGVVWPLELLRATADAAHDRGLKVHIDGSRVWNAAVALGVDLATIARPGDTLSACFSKGLGCPVGSILLGTKETIDRARHRRKMLGGGMRQAGVLAAAALHALDHHLGRLAEDHRRARTLAESLVECSAFAMDPTAVETNLVYVPIAAEAVALGHDAVFWEQRLREAGILCYAEGNDRIRLVT